MRHEKINGQLLNMDKTWKHLSMKQRNWICDQFRSEYISYVSCNGKHPGKDQCRAILHTVYDQIQERGIWIPFNEVKIAFSAKLQRYRKIQIAKIV